MVAVRRRDGGRFDANPTRVAAINGFYDFRAEDGEVSKDVERFLAQVVEGPASSALAAIDASGRPPAPGSDERHAIASFIAFQMVRTPERRAEMMLAESVAAFLDGRQLTDDLMAEYLETVHLGFKPSTREARAAALWVGYQLYHLDPGTSEMTMRIMYDTATTLTPTLSAMHWSLAVDRKERLITADQPVLVWKRPSPREAYLRVGIQTADEIRVPLDPGKQLVLRHRSRPEAIRLSSDDVAACNLDIATRCHAFVVASPKQSTIVDAVRLRARGPAVRFDVGFRYERDDRGQLVKTEDEILHTWLSRL